MSHVRRMHTLAEASAAGRHTDALAAARSLKADLLGRLESVETIREKLEARAPDQSKAYRERLEKRMKELLGSVDAKVEDGRLLHEVAVFAERSDVAEELSRLASHLEQAKDLLEGTADKAVGRRLDFICQEMFREANTVASKVSDIKLSELAIELKAELERMREQVQNVE